MRVITGTAKGMKLFTLDGKDVRPTSEKVKEAVFSAIQFDIEGRRMLDLFAGCGQMGIEALSRGAESCVFVDASKASLDTVKKNVEKVGFSDRSKLVLSDYSLFLQRCTDKFDIAFLDPPYSAGILVSAIESVAKVMSDYGTIICEYPPEVLLPANIGDFEVYRKYKYGKICVAVYKKETLL